MAYGVIPTSFVTALTGKAADANSIYTTWISWASDGTKDINVNAGTINGVAAMPATCTINSSVTYNADIHGYRSVLQFVAGEFADPTYAEVGGIVTLTPSSGYIGLPYDSGLNSYSWPILVPRSGSIVGVNTRLQQWGLTPTTACVTFKVFKNGASMVTSKVHSLSTAISLSTEHAIYARGLLPVASGDLLSAYVIPEGISAGTPDNCALSISLEYQMDD